MRRLAALVLASLLGCLGAGCGGPCTAQVKAKIQATYSAQVLAACAGRKSLAACPDLPALRAERRTAQEAAGCR